MRRGTGSQPINVLLIEDNPDDAFLFRESLGRYNSTPFKIEHADRLSLGMERIGHDSFDVAVLDLSLPDSDGIDTLRQFLSIAPNRPTVVLTGLEDAETGARAIAAGAQDYLFKGRLDGDVLARTLLFAMERAELTDEIQGYLLEIQANEERLREIIRRTVDGIVVLDSHGLVRFANPAAEELLARSLDELDGEPLHLPRPYGAFEEVRLVSARDETRVVEIREVDITWERKPAFLISLRDVTQRVMAEQQLEQTRREQMELKDHFLSHVSHELGTPIAAVIDFVTILLDDLAGKLKQKQREFLEIALNNARQLEAMIGDLLEITRFRLGKLPVYPQPVALSPIIHGAVASLRGKAERAKARISAAVPGDLPEALADPDRVVQVLLNLLDNAVKFAPGGAVEVKASMAPDGENLQVEVSDTGCGMRAEEVDRAFDYLYQGETGQVGSRKGLGLGLHICKTLLARQHGKIWAESELGVGTTFTFSLPNFRHFGSGSGGSATLLDARQVPNGRKRSSAPGDEPAWRARRLLHRGLRRQGGPTGNDQPAEAAA
jgi:signal transduction histidine kinase